MNGEIKSTINVLPPFKRFCMTIGELPASYLETMSYYEMLLWFTKYLSETVIPAINNNAEAVKELQDLFVELQNYVNNYFDNLDVQEEINNKLDEMTEDGTLAQIINEQIFNNLNTLIGSTTNPIYYGADPTGVNDSTTAINSCIEANKGGTINFTMGSYKVSDSILLPFDNSDKVSINGNGAKLIIDDDIDYLFWVGYDRESEASRNDVGFPSYIKDLFINAENYDVDYGIFNVKGFKDLNINNCFFYRVKNGVLIGEATGSPSDTLITNCLFYGKGSEHEGTGIIINCSDNNINSSRLYGFREGIILNSYSTITSVHTLLRWENQTTTNFDPYPIGSSMFLEYYEPTCFAKINNACRIVTCYADSVYKFLDIGNITSHVVLTSSFYYNARTGVNQHIIDCVGDAIKLDITDCQFSLSTGNDVSILKCTNETGVFNAYSQITISGIEIVGIANLTNYSDIILTGYTNKLHTNIQLQEDTWYVISSLANWIDYSKGDIDIFINDWKYSLRFAENTVNTISLNQYGSSDTTTHYTLGIVRDDDVAYICVKADTTTGGDKLYCRLNESNNLLFNVPPVYGDALYRSNRLLSNFTNETPSQILNLCQAYNIKNSSNNS